MSSQERFPYDQQAIPNWDYSEKDTRGEVLRLIDHLDERINDAQKELALLNEKLSPVVRSSTPHTNDAAQAEPRPDSHVGQLLVNRIDAVNELIDALSDLRIRLCL